MHVKDGVDSPLCKGSDKILGLLNVSHVSLSSDWLKLAPVHSKSDNVHAPLKGILVQLGLTEGRVEGI